MRSALLIVLMVLATGCARQAGILGDHVLSDRELVAAARRPLAAYAGEGQTPADLIDAAEAMRARLDREGYPLAQVTAEAGSPPTFAVVQGPRVALGGLDFTGECGLPAGELLAAAMAEPWYTSATGSAVRGRVVRALRGAGHLQALVAEPVESWSPDRSRVHLTFVVQAGPRFVLGAIRLELAAGGDPGGQWDVLRGRLTPLLDAPGGPVLPRTVSGMTARLRGLLLDLGHLQATVVAAPRVQPASALVEVDFAISPGPVHVLRRLSVEGGARSAPGFVANRLGGLEVGRPLSQGAIDRSVTALLTTGLFRRVEAIPTTGAANADGTVPDDVTMRLRELPTQHVDFAFGWGSYERLRGGVTYVDDHLFGQGLRFSTGVEASTVGWEANVMLIDPFRFGPGRRVTLDVAMLERREPSFSHQEVSTGLNLTRRLKPAFDPVPWETRTGWRFARSEDYNIEAVDTGEQPEPLYTTSTLRYEVRRDTREPRVIDPESGMLCRAGVGWSAPPLGATVDYGELSAEWSGAWSPAPWLVATVRGAATTRDPGVIDELPIGERLFMGGADTVRSFSQDDLGPRAANGEPLGGQTSAVANLELRWRLFPDHREVEIATFYDLGMVDPKAWSLAAPWGSGLGAGLRYRTPVGPVRFDAAVDPRNDLGADQDWAMHLTVGFAF
jgi:outer membrane protein assembly factor BamA